MSTPRTSRSRRRPAVTTLVKDTGAWLLGVGLIVHQAGFVPPQDFNLTLVLLGAALIGVPGVSQLLASRIGPSPSPGQPEVSPESPPSSSSASSGADR
jgi:hypothetical protein